MFLSDTKDGNTQYTHCTFLSARIHIYLKLQAENVCFGFYTTHVRWKCKYEDTKCVQVRHNNVNVFVRTLKEQKQIKTYTVYLSFLETICK